MSDKTVQFPLWLVGEPHSESTADDIVHPIRDMDDLIEKLGWGKPDDLFTDEDAARVCAARFIEERDAAARSTTDAYLVAAVEALRRLIETAGKAGDERLATLAKPAAGVLDRELTRRIEAGRGATP